MQSAFVLRNSARSGLLFAEEEEEEEEEEMGGAASSSSSAEGGGRGEGESIVQRAAE